MTDEPLDPMEARVAAWAEAVLAEMRPEHREECRLFASLEPGMRIRFDMEDPELVELLWGGAVVSVGSRTALVSGVEDDQFAERIAAYADRHGGETW